MCAIGVTIVERKNLPRCAEPSLDDRLPPSPSRSEIGGTLSTGRRNREIGSRIAYRVRPAGDLFISSWCAARRSEISTPYSTRLYLRGLHAAIRGHTDDVNISMIERERVRVHRARTRPTYVRRRRGKAHFPCASSYKDKVRSRDRVDRLEIEERAACDISRKREKFRVQSCFRVDA